MLQPEFTNENKCTGNGNDITGRGKNLIIQLTGDPGETKKDVQEKESDEKIE